MDREEYHFSMGISMAIYGMMLVTMMFLFEVHIMTAIFGLFAVSILHFVELINLSL